VLGERIVTPGAIVQLVVAARLIPPNVDVPVPVVLRDDSASKAKEERHHNFLSNRTDAEDLPSFSSILAHAPRWPDVSTFWPLLFLQLLTACVVLSGSQT
jgi:translocation protein SEC63